MLFHYMLDTDIASYGSDRRDETLDRHLRFVSPGSLCVSSVTAAEMLFGTRRFPPQHPSRLRVEAFLRRANVLSWNLAAAEAYADIRHTLTTSGQTIGDLDMMIAAHALSAGLTLVSNNTAHFERLVPPLQLENWTET